MLARGSGKAARMARLSSIAFLLPSSDRPKSHDDHISACSGEVGQLPDPRNGTSNLLELLAAIQENCGILAYFN
jgi:hypothetical protein